MINSDSILAFAALCACPIMYYHLRNFVRVLDDAVKLQGGLQDTNEDVIPESSSPRPLSDRKAVALLSKGSKRSSLPKTSTEVIAQLRRKINGILITATISSSLVFVVCLMCAIFQFASRTVPLSWLVYYAITCCIGLFACQLAYTSQRTPPTLSSSKGSRGDLSPAPADRRGSIMVSTNYQGSTPN